MTTTCMPLCSANCVTTGSAARTGALNAAARTAGARNRKQNLGSGIGGFREKRLGGSPSPRPTPLRAQGRGRMLTQNGQYHGLSSFFSGGGGGADGACAADGVGEAAPAARAASRRRASASASTGVEPGGVDEPLNRRLSVKLSSEPRRLPASAEIC